jgi:uncharacterized protein (TIGR02145 family)
MTSKKLLIFLSIVINSFAFGQRSENSILQLKKGEKWVTEIIGLDIKMKEKTDSLNSIKGTVSSQDVRIQEFSIKIKSLEEFEDFSKIGDQYWMNTNLDVTSFNDGTELKLAQSKEDWDDCFNNKIPAYCYHQNDSLKKNGVLYNIHALNSGKLAPEGFFIPTKQDVEILISSFGKLQSFASLILKSKEKNSWENPGLDLFYMNINPDGFRLNDGHDWYTDNKVYFFHEDVKESVSFFVFSGFSDKINFLNRNVSSDNVNYGMYVRCLKVNK